MNTCKYCEKKRAGLNEKGHCPECVKLQKEFLKSNLLGRDISTIQFTKTVEELKELASLLNIKGRSKMNKSQLVEAVYNSFNELIAAEKAAAAEKNEAAEKAAAATMQPYKCEQCKNETTDFENIGDRIFCTDCLEFDTIVDCLENANEEEEEINEMKIGYAIINYHDGSTIETTEISALFDELQQLEKAENAAGFYKVLKVDTCIMLDGSRHYFNSDPIEEYEVKTAAEIVYILIKFETDAAAAEIAAAAATVTDVITENIPAAPAVNAAAAAANNNEFIFYGYELDGKKEIFAYKAAENEKGLYSLHMAEKALLTMAAAAGRYNEVLKTMQHIKVTDNNKSDLFKAVIGREYHYNSFENENTDYIKSCFDEIKAINKRLFEYIPFPVIFTDHDEYSSAAEMRQRVIKEKVIYIYKGFSGHPFLSQEENCIGRAIHDVFAHLVCGCPFNFQGEYSAFIEQSKYYPKHLRAVLFAEIPAQTAAYYYNNNFEFNQRAFAAPDRWQQLLKGFEKDYSKNSIMQPFKELQFV